MTVTGLTVQNFAGEIGIAIAGSGDTITDVTITGNGEGAWV